MTRRRWSTRCGAARVTMMSNLACPDCRRVPGAFVRRITAGARKARVDVQCGCGTVDHSDVCGDPRFGRGGRAAERRRLAIIRDAMIAAGCVEVGGALPATRLPPMSLWCKSPALIALLAAEVMAAQAPRGVPLRPSRHAYVSGAVTHF